MQPPLRARAVAFSQGWPVAVAITAITPDHIDIGALVIDLKREIRGIETGV